MQRFQFRKSAGSPRPHSVAQARPTPTRNQSGPGKAPSLDRLPACVLFRFPAACNPATDADSSRSQLGARNVRIPAAAAHLPAPLPSPDARFPSHFPEVSQFQQACPGEREFGGSLVAGTVPRSRISGRIGIKPPRLKSRRMLNVEQRKSGPGRLHASRWVHKLANPAELPRNPWLLRSMDWVNSRDPVFADERTDRGVSSRRAPVGWPAGYRAGTPEHGGSRCAGRAGSGGIRSPAESISSADRWRADAPRRPVPSPC